MTGHDDYLWSGRGTPDRDVQMLERQLSTFALSRTTTPRRLPRRRRRHAIGMALAATLAFLAVGITAWLQHRLLWPDGAAWPVIAGHGVRIEGGGSPAALAPGDMLVTGADGWARLRVARIGELRVEPSSRIEMQATSTGRHRVRLVHGQLSARIWAPPQQFGVVLPKGRLWDLGCEFSVQSDVDGRGWLRVDSGWVLLERDGVEVLVPQGAEVAMRDGKAIGTPHAQDAPAALKLALAVIDAREAPITLDDPAIATLAALARPADAITLLSLMQRHPKLADSPVFDRFVEVVPAAGAIRRESLRQADREALDRAWDALPYPRTKAWWWHWRDGLPRIADAKFGSG